MNETIETILNEREKTHGSFLVHASVTQGIKNILYAKGKMKFNTRQREALDMIAHKIGRIVAGDPNYKDHWDDIAGYALLVSKGLEEERREENDE